MGFFAVEDGEGGSIEDRVVIVAIACLSVAWIPVMLVWKCIASARSRNDLERGNKPVTTQPSDPEKIPQPVLSHDGQSIDMPDQNEDARREDHAQAPEIELPRRPEPLTGGRRHRSHHRHHEEKDSRHTQRRGDVDVNSASRTRSKQKRPVRAKSSVSGTPRDELSHGSSRRSRQHRAESDHYPDEPLRRQHRDQDSSHHRSRRHHAARRDEEPSTDHEGLPV